MKITWAVLALLFLPTTVGSQTLLGNCGSGITGIQLSTGNIYCMPVPAGCAPDGGTDWSDACDLPLLPAIGF